MRSIGSFWRSDRGLTALLLFLLVALLVAPPLIEAGILSTVLFDVLFTLILISGVATVSGRKWPAVVTSILSIATLAIRWIRVAGGHPGLALLDSSLAVLVVLTLAGLVLFQVLRKGPVTVRRIQGATAAYLLFGLAWASAYEFALLARPGAFRFPEGKGDDPISLLYFSFVTLTTVGYGDITPVLPAARSLAVAEALVGQLFPAILIARLVGLELTGRGASKGN
jgi:hypothetical protein